MEKLFSSMQEILSPVNCIVYEIPEFQREYAWGKDQWNALFDDIEANDPGYFIGSIICISGKASGQNEAITYDRTNLMYVAAYLKSFQDNWSSAFPEITDRPDILGSLYNLGHTNNDGTPRKPHSNPQANWFGEKTKMYYGLMPYLLGE